MPVRREITRGIGTPDDSILSYGDGTWSFFQTDPVYQSSELAFDRWQQVRRSTWAQENRFCVPGAAKAYDGITRTGFDLLWDRWRTQDPKFFAADEILAAFEADREAVARFRREDRTGAQQIDYFLDMLIEDFTIGESETQRLSRLIGVEIFPGRPEITSASKFGDTENSETGRGKWQK